MLVRRRLIIWLVKAYLKKWRKTIVISFIVGFAVFFLLIKFIPQVIAKIPVGQKKNVGVVGPYTLQDIPITILNLASYGLTKVDQNGKILPGIAKSWQIQDGGKTYVFSLQQNLIFSDGSPVTSKEISYNFTEAKIERPDKYTIVFHLKEPYAPFLVKLSNPVFKSGMIGVGEYIIKNIKLNGTDVQSLTLISHKNKFNVINYQVYDSEEKLKTAYVLGEVSSAQDLTTPAYNKTDFSTFPNTVINKKTNYNKLVTLFYNTQDKVLSDKKIRSALSYSLPDSLDEGERNYGPYAKKFWTYKNSVEERKQDLSHAKLLLQASSASAGATLNLEIKTLPKYTLFAKKIADEWKKLNVTVSVTEVTQQPALFQVFLHDFTVSKDPDQYTLWHSNQQNNITNYLNLRIDKLLEDGRKTTDPNQRLQIYEDFQKYLLDDAPAQFLYFPYSYDITRN